MCHTRWVLNQQCQFILNDCKLCPGNCFNRCYHQNKNIYKEDSREKKKEYIQLIITRAQGYLINLFAYCDLIVVRQRLSILSGLIASPSVKVSLLHLIRRFILISILELFHVI